MDESLAEAVVDLSGRPFLKFDATFKARKVGDFSTDVVEEFFQGFAAASSSTVHIRVRHGRSDHHKIEAIFKAFARALDEATQIDQRVSGVPSTKGTL
jgi:imidazoleglycerol-phosphate dehydratase